jgi:hypothetical protein
MDRRFFLTSAIGAAAGLAAKQLMGSPETTTKTVAEKVTLSFDYVPPDKGWGFHLGQELDCIVDPAEVDRLVNGGTPLYHTDFGSRPFPSPPRLESVKHIRQKAGGGLFDTEIDPTVPPRYYHVGPARFTAYLDGKLVAASPEGQHFTEDVPFDAFYAASKDEYTLQADPLIAVVAKYVTYEGFETIKFKEFVGAVGGHQLPLCWFTSKVLNVVVHHFLAAKGIKDAG